MLWEERLYEPFYQRPVASKWALAVRSARGWLARVCSIRFRTSEPSRTGRQSSNVVPNARRDARRALGVAIGNPAAPGNA